MQKKNQTQSGGDDVDTASNLIAEEASSPNGCTQRFTATIVQYLLKQVPEFQRLSKLRSMGWENEKGDRYFERQRRTADYANARTTKHFHKMMQKIAKEIDQHPRRKAFQISSSSPDQHSILDLCMAPGGFLKTALEFNPGARALAFSLPPSKGGHNVVIPLDECPNITAHFVDITMLVADIGIPPEAIPPNHPEVSEFILTRHFSPDERFNLAICDGQVLRPDIHKRPQHREQGEATRLTLTQLILSLDHLKPGGTMIVLLHKLEASDTVKLLHAFDKFASVRLYKPKKFHATRSSFYMIATDVRADSEEAARVVEWWRRLWMLATFKVEMEDEAYWDAVNRISPGVEEVLQEFGPKLVKLGRKVWEIQANALETAPWMKQQRGLSWRPVT